MNNRKDNVIRLVCGLGNPGAEYAKTKHNAGFEVVDKLLNKLRFKFEEKKYHNALIWKGRCKGQLLTMVKPMQYMNKSGEAISMFARKLQLDSENILVVYDDVDLPLGKIRIRKNGSSGGHNGIKSIINHLDTENFPRVRVGIGRNSDSQIEHVLSEFEGNERLLYEKVLDLAAEAVQSILYRGITQTMNDYNRKEIE